MSEKFLNTEPITAASIKDSFVAAIPIMLGYIGIGIPCGILSASMGLNWIQVLIFSVFFYSGAGQFMIPNMFFAGANILSIFASVSFVNTRQMLYSAALSPWCAGSKKRMLFWFMATVTDESFGVAIAKFKDGTFNIARAVMLNEFCQISWVVANAVGCLLGPILNIPLPVASFAMTSLFICLAVTSVKSRPAIVTAIAAFAATAALKFTPVSGAAIFFGAIIGVAIGFMYLKQFYKNPSEASA